VYYW